MKFTFDELNILYGLIETAIVENVDYADSFREEWEEAEDVEDRDYWRASIDGVMKENMELNELRKKVSEMMESTRNL